jgi:hypothetical protein
MASADSAAKAKTTPPTQSALGKTKVTNFARRRLAVGERANSAAQTVQHDQTLGAAVLCSKVCAHAAHSSSVPFDAKGTNGVEQRPRGV